MGGAIRKVGGAMDILFGKIEFTTIMSEEALTKIFTKAKISFGYAKIIIST